VVKEKEKEYKEKRSALPKPEKQILKEDQLRELERWKETNTQEFNLRLTEQENKAKKEFQVKQLAEQQEISLRIFLEEIERRKQTKELLHQKKLKHLEALEAAELNQAKQIHVLERDHQDKTKEFEEHQLQETHKKFERDLKRYQSVIFQTFFFFFFFLSFFLFFSPPLIFPYM